MKKTLLFTALTAVLFFASCEEETPLEIIELIPTTESIEAAQEGSSYEILYEIKNATENTKVTAACPAEWITNINSNEIGIVRFETLTNETNTNRTDTITVSCDNSSFKVPVTQAGLEEPIIEYDAEVECEVFNGAVRWECLFGRQTWLSNSDSHR